MGVHRGLPSFLELAWSFNLDDVRTITKKACIKLFNDSSVSMKYRIRRAEAANLLAATFLKVVKKDAKEKRAAGESSKADVDDIIEQIQSALQVTMRQAQQ